MEELAVGSFINSFYLYLQYVVTVYLSFISIYRVSTKSGYIKNFTILFIYVIFYPQLGWMEHVTGETYLSMLRDKLMPRIELFLGYVKRESLLNEDCKSKPLERTHYQSVC